MKILINGGSKLFIYWDFEQNLNILEMCEGKESTVFGTENGGYPFLS